MTTTSKLAASNVPKGSDHGSNPFLTASHMSSSSSAAPSSFPSFSFATKADDNTSVVLNEQFRRNSVGPHNDNNNTNSTDPFSGGNFNMTGNDPELNFGSNTTPLSHTTVNSEDFNNENANQEMFDRAMSEQHSSDYLSDENPSGGGNNRMTRRRSPNLDGLTPAEKKLRRKEKCREAASRFRMRKREELEQLTKSTESMTKRHQELSNQLIFLRTKKAELKQYLEAHQVCFNS